MSIGDQMASYLVNVANQERYRRIYERTEDKLWLELVYREYILLYASYRWYFSTNFWVDYHYDATMLNMFYRLLRLEQILFAGYHLLTRLERNSSHSEYLKPWA